MTKTYSINRAEIAKLQLAREAQVLRAKASNAALAEQLTTRPAEDLPEVAAVEFRNGCRDVRPVALGLLTKWIKLLPDTVAAFQVELQPGAVRWNGGQSSITLRDCRQFGKFDLTRQYNPDTTEDICKIIAEPLVVAETVPGMFECLAEVNSAELAELRAGLRSKAKIERHHKALAKAAQIAREYKSNLAALVADYRKAVETVNSADVATETAQARTWLAATREARRLSRFMADYWAGRVNLLASPVVSADVLAMEAKRRKLRDGAWNSRNISQADNLKIKIGIELADAGKARLAGMLPDGAYVTADKPELNPSRRHYGRRTTCPAVTVPRYGRDRKLMHARKVLRQYQAELAVATAGYRDAIEGWLSAKSR